MPPVLPLMYAQLAEWWPLLSPPEDYADEAEFLRELLAVRGCPVGGALLELGCGGGHLASHLRQHFALTLSDLSPAMLAQSRHLNPACAHVEGDMRSLRLGRDFDAVLVHDASNYLLTPEDLHAAIATARVHCRDGGVVVFIPDETEESFMETTVHGGTDGNGRGIRYLEWTHDPDPLDGTYVLDFTYLLRGPGSAVTTHYDRHICGLHPREAWLDALAAAGFTPGNAFTPWGKEAFIGTLPPANDQ